MGHEHRPIIICDHVNERPNKFPDVLWVESGEVQAAICLECAHEANISNQTGEDPPEAMKPICIECARIDGFPVIAKMADGFYERENGQWIKQPDACEVN
jgi:hypothetical protein